jgi:predicted nucleic acid-binding protein
VARIIVLDSEVLGLACASPRRPEVARCHAWLLDLDLAGALVFIPAIADYEVRRGLLLAGATAGLRRLDNLLAGPSYAPLSDPALKLAAELWARLRRVGLPTAPDRSLDADCLIAAQATLLCGSGDTVTIATRNTRHFARFPGLAAAPWETIVP